MSSFVQTTTIADTLYYDCYSHMKTSTQRTQTERMTKNIASWHWNVNALAVFAGAFYE